MFSVMALHTSASLSEKTCPTNADTKMLEPHGSIRNEKKNLWTLPDNVVEPSAEKCI